MTMGKRAPEGWINSKFRHGSVSDWESEAEVRHQAPIKKFDDVTKGQETSAEGSPYPQKQHSKQLGLVGREEH